jgi:transcriptional regulator with XRE-family HTH domain
VASPKSAQHIALGKALRELRTERGLTQEDVAFRSGLHRNYVGACERGEINLSFSALLRLLQGLDSSLRDVVDRYERRAP